MLNIKMWLVCLWNRFYNDEEEIRGLKEKFVFKYVDFLMWLVLDKIIVIFMVYLLSDFFYYVFFIRKFY